MREFSGFQKGVNLGGWISQFSKYDEKHFDSFITEKDIEFISSLGFDHVRVPVDYIVLLSEVSVRRARINLQTSDLLLRHVQNESL